MKVLVVNCGSSSIKYQLINMENESVMAKGYLEKIGLPDSFLTHTVNGEKRKIEELINNHEEGIKLVGVKFGEEDGVKTLFVTIDREEEPVDLDLCVKATNIVNPIIDELNLDIEDYVLDVSSKGEC